MPSQKSWIAAAACAVLSMVGAGAEAQTQWPTQPIRLVVPNPPGGLPDILARALSDPLRARLGQPIIVENRPGANAGIGAAAIASSKPDGYTYLVSDSAVVNISHLLNAQLPFDRKNLMPVAMIVKGPLFVAAGPNVPINSFKEMIDYVKANPGKVNYGSIGVGSFHHLTMEEIQSGLGLKLNHIPYKGSGESLTALRAGNIEIVISAYAGLLPLVKAKQARFLAQNTLTRSKYAQDVPTIAENIPGFELGHHQDLYARAGTPIEIANKMAAVVAEVVKDPEVSKRIDTLGLEPALAGPAEVKTFLDAEGVRIKKIVDAAGLKPN